MASNSQCGPCARGDECSTATKWCVNCEDSLCVSCVKSHKVNKATNSHHIIDLDAISDISREKLNSQKPCSKHPSFIMDFFCSQHDCICCRSCIAEDHRTCTALIPVEIASKDSKTSSLHNDILEELKGIRSTLNTVVQNRNEGKDKLVENGEDIIKSISAFKILFVMKLEEMEKESLKELEQTRKDSLADMEKDGKEAEEFISQTERILQQISFLEQNGTDQHMFLLLKEIQPIITLLQVRLGEFVGKLSDVKLVFNQKGDILSSYKDLGSITAQRTQSAVNNTSKNTKAQAHIEQSTLAQFKNWIPFGKTLFPSQT